MSPRDNGPIAPPPDGWRWHDNIAGVVKPKRESIMRRFGKDKDRARAVEFTAVGIGGILERARLAIEEVLGAVPLDARRDVLAEAQRRHEESSSLGVVAPLVQVVSPAWFPSPSSQQPKPTRAKLSLVPGGKPGPDEGVAP